MEPVSFGFDPLIFEIISPLLNIRIDEGTALPQLSQEVFRGIPYANSSRRLHLASSLNETWTSTRPAFDYGVTCPGAGTQNQFGWEIAEDCLNFNLARPAGTAPNQSLPVMVWIYGGGFYQGSIQDPEFNQSYLVQTSQEIGLPTIVITLNSRLSAWGFMNSEEAIRQGVSNLGLRDIWKFLEWLHGMFDSNRFLLMLGTRICIDLQSREHSRIWR